MEGNLRIAKNDRRRIFPRTTGSVSLPNEILKVVTYPNLKVGGRSLNYSQRRSTTTENDRYLPLAQHASGKRPAHASSYICREHPDPCTPNTSGLYQSANPHDHTIFLAKAPAPPIPSQLPLLTIGTHVSSELRNGSLPMRESQGKLYMSPSYDSI